MVFAWILKFFISHVVIVGPSKVAEAPALSCRTIVAPVVDKWWLDWRFSAGRKQSSGYRVRACRWCHGMLLKPTSYYEVLYTTLRLADTVRK